MQIPSPSFGICSLELRQFQKLCSADPLLSVVTWSVIPTFGGRVAAKCWGAYFLWGKEFCISWHKKRDILLSFRIDVTLVCLGTHWALVRGSLASARRRPTRSHTLRSHQRRSDEAFLMRTPAENCSHFPALSEIKGNGACVETRTVTASDLWMRNLMTDFSTVKKYKYQQSVFLFSVEIDTGHTNLQLKFAIFLSNLTLKEMFFKS
jgi:hypothetical protein